MFNATTKGITMFSSKELAALRAIVMREYVNNLNTDEAVIGDILRGIIRKIESAQKRKAHETT